MDSTIKAFIVSIVLFLFFMWFNFGSFTFGESLIGAIGLLVAFGITFGFIKHDFFSNKDKDK